MVSRNPLRPLLLTILVCLGGLGLALGWNAPAVLAQVRPATETAAVAAADVSPAAPAASANGQLAAADLRMRAAEAVKKGRFDQSFELLAKAAEVSGGAPLDQKLVTWAKQLNEQLGRFTSERTREYDKTVRKIELLVQKDKLVYAMDLATVAHVLALDKEAFLKEPWLVSLMAEAEKRADQYDKAGQWLRALRLYSTLSAIEGEQASWKEKFKTSTRRLRVLSLYVPDQVRKLYKEDSKDREEVEALLKELEAKDPTLRSGPAATQPATRPATKPAAAAGDEEEQDRQLRVDWRDQLRGVRMEMLEEALEIARRNYYKEVDFRKVLAGGLEGLRVLATTPALRETFQGLQDDARRNHFVGLLDGRLADLDKPDAQADIRGLLAAVRDFNDTTVKLPEEVWVSEFADGAFANLDPFSGMFWPYNQQELEKTLRGNFSGVGIQIRVDDSGNIKVVTPIEDSPAYRARIKPDSLITHIDGKSARWISIDEAVKRITGPPNTEVTLTIKDPSGDVRDVKLTRERLKVDTVRGWKHNVTPGGVARGWDFFIDPQEKIGYIRLSQFTRETRNDLENALAVLEKNGARGIILDLRHNPGGLLSSAVEIVNMFVTDGMIVSTRPDRKDSPNDGQDFFARPRGPKNKLPLIVLVNQISASASEIVSGALKDHKRAVIVGERTYGKGSVQVVSPLAGQQASVKVTTHHYYLPNGKCIHREENAKTWGVDPDVVVEMTPEQIRAMLDVRQDLDILRDAADAATPAKPEDLPAQAEKVADAVAQAKKNKDPLAVDAQLAAALFLMRLDLNQKPAL